MFCPAMKRVMSLGRDTPIKFYIVFLSGSEADKLNSYAQYYIEHLFVCQYVHMYIQIKFTTLNQQHPFFFLKGITHMPLLQESTLFLYVEAPN